jgi:hypothetical protein
MKSHARSERLFSSRCVCVGKDVSLENARSPSSETNYSKRKHALGNEFRAKHVAKRGSNLKVGRVENYRDETSVRVRKGRDGLGE